MIIIKRLISFCLCSVIIAASTTVLAANEQHEAFDVTMKVEDSVINHTTDKLFGFNFGVPNTSPRRIGWLDKNYAKYDAFENDFEDESYTMVEPEYKQAYFYPGAKNTVSYIANGDKYKGSVSYTSYMVKSGVDLYDNQYDSSGNLQPPSQNVEAAENNKFVTVNPNNLVTGGIDGYQGFNLFWKIAKGNDLNDIEDLTIVKDGLDNSNHAVKLSPGKGDNYGGRASFFGKNSLAILDRKTNFKFRIKIDSNIADVRLGITKDWNTEQVKDIESQKYCTVYVPQFIKEYNTNQERGWLDTLRFKDGSIFNAQKEIGKYHKSMWYTIDYTLDAPLNGTKRAKIKVCDDQGNEIVTDSSEIDLKHCGMGEDIPEYKSLELKDFKFEERSDFGYLFAAFTDVHAKEKTTALVDDFKFETLVYYDDKDAVLNEKLKSFKENNSFAYSRFGGTSANWFKWKSGLEDAKERERISRQSSEVSVQKNREYFALPEWLKFVDYMNLNSKHSYVINILDSDEDIIDLVEFLTADDDINGDGVNWAQVRKDNGVENPARVYMWEIGNEPDINYMDPGTWSKKWDVDSYLKRAGEIVKILKQYSPSIKIGIPVNTDYLLQHFGVSTEDNQYSPSNNWDTKILSQDWAGEIDELVYHSYDPDRGTPITLAILKLKESILKSDYKDIKIAYTEHGTQRPAKSENYYQGIGLASALCEAQFYNRIFADSIVDCANIHSFSLYPGPWGIGYLDEDNEFKAGATYRLVDLYAKNGVGSVLKSSIDGFSLNPDETHWDGWDHTNQKWLEGKYGYSCSAIKAEDGTLNLFISNSRNHTLNLSLDLDSKFDHYTIREKSVITGKNADDTITSYDGYSYVYNEETGSCDKLQYRNEMIYNTEYELDGRNVQIEPYSITLIKLSEKSLTPLAVQYNGQQRLDISGTVQSPDSSRLVSIYIEDKETKETKYIDDTKLDNRNGFRFNFEFNYDLKKCNVYMNCCGEYKNLTDNFKMIDHPNEVFNVQRDANNEIIISNRYNMQNVEMKVIAAVYDGNRLENMKMNKVYISGSDTKIEFLNIDNESGKKYKILFWDNIDKVSPALSAVEFRS